MHTRAEEGHAADLGLRTRGRPGRCAFCAADQGGQREHHEGSRDPTQVRHVGVHSDEQSSPSIVLPSSHDSPDSMIMLPQRMIPVQRSLHWPS